MQYPDNPFDDPNEEEPDDSGVACNRCGIGGLEWMDTGVRWRLVDSTGHFHTCPGAGNFSFEDAS